MQSEGNEEDYARISLPDRIRNDEIRGKSKIAPKSALRGSSGNGPMARRTAIGAEKSFSGRLLAIMMRWQTSRRILSLLVPSAHNQVIVNDRFFLNDKR